MAIKRFFLTTEVRGGPNFISFLQTDDTSLNLENLCNGLEALSVGKVVSLSESIKYSRVKDRAYDPTPETLTKVVTGTMSPAPPDDDIIELFRLWGVDVSPGANYSPDTSYQDALTRFLKDYARVGSNPSTSKAVDSVVFATEAFHGVAKQPKPFVEGT